MTPSSDAYSNRREHSLRGSSIYSNIRSAVFAGGLAALATCSSDQKQFALAAPSETSYQQGSGLEQSIEQFVSSLPKNAAVLVGYNRWDYVPGPGNFPQAPSIEILRKELVEAREHKNTERADSIKDTISLTDLLERKKIDFYLRSIQSTNPQSGFHVHDYSPTHIISSGLKVEEADANKIKGDYEFVRKKPTPSPDQKISNTTVRFYYMRNGKLEEIGGENK